MGSYKRIKKPSFQPSKASQNPHLQQKRELGLPQQQPKGQTLEEMEIARKNAERLGDHMFDFSSTSPPGVQAKLNVGEAGDKYEQEADSVASQVVEEINSSQGEVGPSVMRQCEVCEAEKEKPSTSLQRQGEVTEGKALDGFLHDNERVGQDGFIYQGDYAQELTPMVQLRREQTNSFAVQETGQRGEQSLINAKEVSQSQKLTNETDIDSVVKSSNDKERGTEKECADLLKKMRNHIREIKERIQALADDQHNLPETTPNDHKKPRESRRGHRSKIEEHRRALEKHKGNYLKKCGQLPEDIRQAFKSEDVRLWFRLPPWAVQAGVVITAAAIIIGVGVTLPAWGWAALSAIAAYLGISLIDNRRQAH
ncbi:MAG: hypothetical protein WA865_04135 [Spirulinaceae cyanobacterium]